MYNCFGPKFTMDVKLLASKHVSSYQLCFIKNCCMWRDMWCTYRMIGVCMDDMSCPIPLT